MVNVLFPSASDVARATVTETLRDIVEPGGHGRVVGLGQAVSLVQDDEPIIGLEATEFGRGAAPPGTLRADSPLRAPAGRPGAARDAPHHRFRLRPGDPEFDDRQ